ncbi:hypothetical protein CALCODRAFT_500311 [Calocera cornea HHB12733]|uniref:WW domain-containing protein n=1 Tax=Calocera cornea HHB12733 TaxID=1353952 RepID=A0A165E4C4_9BASI|nr:hypothetical protein CALCODRAFT_500311 [Calocera cornea HHB12733]
MATSTSSSPSRPTPSWKTLPLPPQWEERKDANGRTYYVDHCSRKSHWIHPLDPNSPWNTRPLPPGWEIFRTREHKIYYVDHNTRSMSEWDPRYPIAEPKESPRPRREGWEAGMSPVGEVGRGYPATNVHSNPDPRSHDLEMILNILSPTLAPDWELKTDLALLGGGTYFKDRKTGAITWADRRTPPSIPTRVLEKTREVMAPASLIEDERPTHEDASTSPLQREDGARYVESYLETEQPISIPRNKAANPFDAVYGLDEPDGVDRSSKTRGHLPDKLTGRTQATQTKTNISKNPFRDSQNQPASAGALTAPGRAMRAYLSDL